LKLILIITDLGSFNNFLYEISNTFCSYENNRLFVICSNKKIINVNRNYLIKSNIEFIFLDIPRGFSPYKLIKSSVSIRQLIKSIQPDLIHAHFTTAAFPTILFKIKNYKYWTTLHGLGINSTKGLKKIIFFIVENFIFSKFDKIIVLNNQDYNFLNRNFHAKLLKHSSFGVGCDLLRYDKNIFSQHENDNLKKHLKIDSNHFVLTFTGRFVNFKGFHLVIKVFKKLCNIYPNKYKLILIGDEDPLHPTGLEIEDQLFFKTSTDIIKTGFTNEVNKYLSVSNLFIFPSKKEGLPVCILESLSMGVPVVTFNSRGNCDIVEDRYNGLLVKTNSSDKVEIDSFFNAVLELCSNEKLYNNLVSNALSERNLYSRENFVNDNIRLYKNTSKF